MFMPSGYADMLGLCVSSFLGTSYIIIFLIQLFLFLKYIMETYFQKHNKVHSYI